MPASKMGHVSLTVKIKRRRRRDDPKEYHTVKGRYQTAPPKDAIERRYRGPKTSEVCHERNGRRARRRLCSEPDFFRVKSLPSWSQKKYTTWIQRFMANGNTRTGATISGLYNAQSIEIGHGWQGMPVPTAKPLPLREPSIHHLLTLLCGTCPTRQVS